MLHDAAKVSNIILRLKKELESQGERLPPGLTGMFGELMAFKKLKSMMGKKIGIRYFTGQKGADIQLVSGLKTLNIEIKTSRLKDEGHGLWYGAALNIKKCNKHKRPFDHPRKGPMIGDFCYFDFILFVTLNESFTNSEFYVIPRSFVEKNENLLQNKHSRFSNATHRIYLSNGESMPRDMAREQKTLIKKTELFKDRWDLLQQELAS